MLGFVDDYVGLPFLNCYISKTVAKMSYFIFGMF